MGHCYLLHHSLERAVSAHPSAEAIVDLTGGRRSFDYEKLYRLTSACAARLQDRALQRGDRVGVYLPKSAEEACAIFAVTLAGGVFVSVNSLLLGAQVAHILMDCGVKYLITSSSCWKRISQDAAKVASLVCLLLIDEKNEVEHDVPVVFDVMCCDHPPRTIPSVGEDLAGILYTSGSTGKPRGVMLSHRNLLAGSRIVSSYLKLCCSDRLLSVIPFSFDYGLNQLLTTVEHQAVIVLLQFRFPAEITTALRNEAISGFAGVPLIWAGLTHRSSGMEQTNLPALRYITNTGGMVPTATVRTLRRLLPTTQIFLMYGLTEAFRSTYLSPEEVDRRPDSIGKAIPETEIFVINSEGRLAKAGEPGILVHRGPTVSLGYWGKPELTSTVIRPHPFIPSDQGGGVVCYSGDLVKTDEEGFIYFIGRVDAQIKSQGYRVSPSEVEEVLMQGNEFAQVAVIGLPGTDGAGERIHAIVVPHANRHFDPAAVLRRCTPLLPSYMLPRSIEVVEVLPSTPNGKIDYKLLREQRLK